MTEEPEPAAVCVEKPGECVEATMQCSPPAEVKFYYDMSGSDDHGGVIFYAEGITSACKMATALASSPELARDLEYCSKFSDILKSRQRYVCQI